MTHDFSNVEVGDKVSFKYEGVVEYIDGISSINLHLGRGLVLTPEESPEVKNLTFTKPLPTKRGSVVQVGQSFYMRGGEQWTDPDGNLYSTEKINWLTFTVIYDAGKAEF